MSTQRLTAAQALVRYLQVQFSERDGERARAIPAIFGIFGHGNVCGLGQALAELGGDLPFHQPKHEQAMVHTALGFAKATRRLSTLACTASIGPGATNLVTGAATATTNRLPVLLLPGDTFANRRQGPVLQQLQHPGYADWGVNESLRSVSRFFDRIARPEQLLTALPEAMRVLLDPAETGAVTIALHQDVQGEAYDYPARFFEPRTWAVTRRPPAPEEIAAVAALLRTAERPLIVAGGGVRYSAAERALAQLAERRGIPVAETSAGKGTAECGLALGGIGVNGTQAANRIAAAADLVLCVGTRLSDFTTASSSLFEERSVRFAGVNVCAADAHRLGAVPVVADARLALEALDAALGEWSTSAGYRAEVEAAVEAWDEVVREHLADGGAAPGDGAGGVGRGAGASLTQTRALATINATARAGDWLVAAAGAPPGDLLKLWRCPPGSSAHIEFAFSCMGHEIPAGLGIRLARPDAGEVVAVIGDGTYLMAPTELATAVQEGLKLTIVILVNGAFGSIRELQRSTVGHTFGTEFRRGAGSGDALRVDYAANAESLGCAAFRAGTAQELEQALAAARDCPGPAVIECRVEPLPAPPSGAWWDLGVPAVSRDERVLEAAGRQRAGAAKQRYFG